MKEIKTLTPGGNPSDRKKVLLLLLPYWTPQIPPIGISCLKAFLRRHGYRVTIGDLNVEETFREIYNDYFDLLREYACEGRRGSFYNIGHEVLQNHMMAHQNYDDETAYIQLVKELIYKTFFHTVDDARVIRLSKILDKFYQRLDEFLTPLLEKEKPGVLGLSVYKGTIPASMFAFRLTREKFPHIRTVMGGAVFAQSLDIGTPNFDYFLEKTKDYIDKIIVGEGEHLFLKLLNGELPPSQRVFTLDDIGNKTLDLATAPFPDFEGLNLDFYPHMSSYTSRSCPFECSFCTETVYWKKYRKKKPAMIVEEVDKLYQKHRSQLFLMCDSLLNPLITPLAQAFIDSGLSIYWDGYLRAEKDVCDPEIVFKWRKGGFYRARLGIESGSDRILDQMVKKIGVEQMKVALATLADAGIKTTTYWIVGYPGETEEDFQMTLDFIEEMKDSIYEAHGNPFGYYVSGQAGSEEWASKNDIHLLYPESARDMLVVQTWRLNSGPPKEETYRRLVRFVDHCTKLGITNPFSLYDIHKADERWQKLHRNAVPPLVEFRKKDRCIDENKYVKLLQPALDIQRDNMELCF